MQPYFTWKMYLIHRKLAAPSPNQNLFINHFSLSPLNHFFCFNFYVVRDLVAIKPGLGNLLFANPEKDLTSHWHLLFENIGRNFPVLILLEIQYSLLLRL